MTDAPSEAGFPAHAIPVALYREIMIWPLALHLRPAPPDAQAVQAAVTRAVDRITTEPSSPWKPVDDPSRHIPPPAASARPEAIASWRAECYAEGVYFHEFVQSFLFSKRFARSEEQRRAQEPDAVPFRLFRRSDVEGVDVTLAGGESVVLRTVALAVERLNLYLFRSGAAVLVVEVAAQPGHEQGFCLNDAQDLHEQFRRAYVPFALPGQKPPGLVVRRVCWRLAGGATSNFAITGDAVGTMIEQYLDHADPDPDTGLLRRSPPLFEHWQWLLGGALPLAPAKLPEGEGSWHHVVDERMPTITSISVTPLDKCTAAPRDPMLYFNNTRRGDLMRLCFADGANRDRMLPYDPRSLTDFESNHTYRAFQDQGSLFLASGYAFVAYGAGCFFDNIVAAVHMRRHYFQIGLLAHLELASLLSFSSRISRAVAEYNPAAEPEEKFERRMQVIEDEYLQFIHRFRFTGASNHFQAREITALWRRHLRLEEIFADLHTEITSATQYLFNRATTRGAATVERLTILGTIGLLAALTFSFLGISIIMSPTDLAAEFHLLLGALHLRRASPIQVSHIARMALGQFTLFCLAAALFCALGAILLGALRRLKERELGLRRRADEHRAGRRPVELDQTVHSWLVRLAAVAGMAAAIGLIASWLVQG